MNVALAAGPGCVVLNCQIGTPPSPTYQIAIVQWDASHTPRLGYSNTFTVYQGTQAPLLQPVIVSNRLVAVNGILLRFNGGELDREYEPDAHARGGIFAGPKVRLRRGLRAASGRRWRYLECRCATLRPQCGCRFLDRAARHRTTAHVGESIRQFPCRHGRLRNRRPNSLLPRHDYELDGAFLETRAAIANVATLSPGSTRSR